MKKEEIDWNYVEFGYLIGHPYESLNCFIIYIMLNSIFVKGPTL